MQAEGRRDESIMPKRRRLKPRIDCVAILGKLSLLVKAHCKFPVGGVLQKSFIFVIW